MRMVLHLGEEDEDGGASRVLAPARRGRRTRVAGKGVRKDGPANKAIAQPEVLLSKPYR